MIALLRGELVRLRTTRTALGFAAAAVILVLASVLIQTLLSDPRSEDDVRSVLSGASSVSILLLVFGVVGATGEHRHGTITSALLIAPDRVRVTLAKLAAYGAAGFLFGLLAQAVAYASGLPTLPSDAESLDSGTHVNLVLGGALSCALSAMLGVAIGTLVRNQVAAVVGSLVYFFVLESTLTAFVEDVSPYTVSSTSSSLGGFPFDNALAWGLAGLVLLAWVAVLGTAGVFADRARDVD